MPKRILVLLPALLGCLVCGGCDEKRDDLIEHKVEKPRTASDREALLKEVAQLARGKDTADAAAMAAYDAAVQHLIARGGAIESEVIDQLRRSEDWSVRLGLVEVLQGIGSRACVEHLIAVLNDVQPLVALRATTTLQELCQHREIPEEGKPVGVNGLPAVPRRAANDLAMDAELRLWTAWMQEYGHTHQLAWERWWRDNRDKVAIK